MKRLKLMTNNTSDTNMALFCDFENVALGVRDAKYPKFNIASPRRPIATGIVTRISR
jgi:hypothetical protein